MTIGEFLKKKREEAQLTQNQLSNKTGLSTSGIFRIENNDRKPSIETLEKYANFFFLNKVLLLELTGYLSKEDIKNYTMSIITTKAMNENNINDDVVKFLREEREKRKISQGQLSYKSGISVSIISKIEQGLRNPTVNTVLSIGKALGIDTMVLLEKMNVVTNEELENHIEKQVAKRLSENIEFLSEQTDKNKLIPIYSSASAGSGRVPEALPEDYLSLPIKNIDNSFGIRVHGDSMYPTITDGAIVIIKTDEEVADRDIGVFLLNDEAYVKRIVRKDNIILLYSDNLDYEPILVTEKDNFYICGKVVKTINKL